MFLRFSLHPSSSLSPWRLIPCYYEICWPGLFTIIKGIILPKSFQYFTKWLQHQYFRDCPDYQSHVFLFHSSQQHKHQLFFHGRLRHVEEIMIYSNVGAGFPPHFAARKSRSACRSAVAPSSLSSAALRAQTVPSYKPSPATSTNSTLLYIPTTRCTSLKRTESTSRNVAMDAVLLATHATVACAPRSPPHHHSLPPQPPAQHHQPRTQPSRLKPLAAQPPHLPHNKASTGAPLPPVSSPASSSAPSPP